MTEVKKTLTTL